MTTDEALKWADTWPLDHAVPSGDAVAMLALAEEVRRLRRGEFICQRCGIRKDSEHEQKAEF